MKEQLIGLDVAKLAELKDCRIIADSFYCEEYEGLCKESEEILIVESLNNPIFDCNQEFGEGKRYYAPTQSLLQKKLRDTHKLMIQIDYGELSNCFWYYILNMKTYCQIENGSTSYKTFEEALEAGLFETLNKIK